MSANFCAVSNPLSRGGLALSSSWCGSLSCVSSCLQSIGNNDRMKPWMAFSPTHSSIGLGRLNHSDSKVSNQISSHSNSKGFCGRVKFFRVFLLFFFFLVVAKVCKSLSSVWLFATPWTAASQSPLSMEFSRPEYWSRLPFPSPGDLPDPGIECRSPALQADSLPSDPPG